MSCFGVYGLGGEPQTLRKERPNVAESNFAMMLSPRELHWNAQNFTLTAGHRETPTHKHTNTPNTLINITAQKHFQARAPIDAHTRTRQLRPVENEVTAMYTKASPKGGGSA